MLTKDDTEYGLTLGRDFGVVGAEKKAFVSQNGKIGVEASASLRYYEVTIKYVTEFQSVVSNIYHTSVATAEALYRDATGGR
ncbi:hypothetical protein [Arsukibacterium sp. MJ3]|uniref:hypothetical protein n=1 Tax=Arsukibacterium sp. MJ3 TaxID=1632859 RepID=UPI00128BDDB2|nr:hypothetical protein [Arsukibacterium sp. MJ3]